MRCAICEARAGEFTELNENGVCNGCHEALMDAADPNYEPAGGPYDEED